jgi:hypothetical protein
VTGITGGHPPAQPTGRHYVLLQWLVSQAVTLLPSPPDFIMCYCSDWYHRRSPSCPAHKTSLCVTAVTGITGGHPPAQPTGRHYVLLQWLVSAGHPPAPPTSIIERTWLLTCSRTPAIFFSVLMCVYCIAFQSEPRLFHPAVALDQVWPSLSNLQKGDGRNTCP